MKGEYNDRKYYTLYQGNSNKWNDWIWYIYIEEGENIKFVTEDNRTIEGTFLFIELSQYEECDDIIHIESNAGERLTFGTSEIKELID